MTEEPEWDHDFERGEDIELGRIPDPSLATLSMSALKVRVRILETRTVYGRTEVLVEPVAGEGRTWVNERRVTR